ncbi:MAG: cation diffusion facilitator family transporter [Sneathiellales bacterium]|nr:cation diffusion facilitator family transporter [Sneathiellales bacterium]
MTGALENRSFLMRSATYGSVAVAITLILFKSWAYFVTDSVAILSTLVDSLMDLGASIVNFLAVRQALIPADHDHRFGHGKAEALAGLFQSALIVGSAVFLLLQAFERLANPVEISESTMGIAVMVFSMSLTFLLVLYQRYVIRKTNSVAISADSLQYMGDILVNASVIVALLLVNQLNWIYADALFAIGIAGYLAFNAWSIIRVSFADLMDEELPDEERNKIELLTSDIEGVLSVQELRTRRSGQKIFVQMHIELAGDISLFEANKISDAVEKAVMDLYPDAEAIIRKLPYQADRFKAEK